MPLGLFKKVGKYPGSGGVGAEPPAGSRGSALVGVQGGRSPLEARAFSESELPREPPLDTHGRYTYNTCTRGGGGGGGEEEGKQEKRKKKSEGLKKSEIRKKSEKQHPCLLV